MLTAANSYSGGTIISGGTLQLAGAGTLGATTATTTINTGGTLDLGGTTQTQAGVTLGGGALQNGVLHAPLISMGGIVNGLSGRASLTLSRVAPSTGKALAPTATMRTPRLTVNRRPNDPTIGAVTGPRWHWLSGSDKTCLRHSRRTRKLTLNGGLTLASVAIYAVSLNPATATFASVTGTATRSANVIVTTPTATISLSTGS